MLFGEVVSASCHSEHNKEVNSGLSSQFQKIKMTGKHFLSITLGITVFEAILSLHKSTKRGQMRHSMFSYCHQHSL